MAIREHAAASSQPSQAPRREGNSGTGRTPSLFPILDTLTLRRQPTDAPRPLALPSATPAYCPDAFAVPCRAIGPLECSTVRYSQECPFPDSIIAHSVHCMYGLLRSAAPSTPLQLSPTQLSSAQPAYRSLAVLRDESTTELRRTSARTRTALPPQQDGSLTAGSRLGSRPPVQRYGSLWPCATLRPPAPFFGPRNRWLKIPRASPVPGMRRRRVHTPH